MSLYNILYRFSFYKFFIVSLVVFNKYFWIEVVIAVKFNIQEKRCILFISYKTHQTCAWQTATERRVKATRASEQAAHPKFQELLGKKWKKTLQVKNKEPR